MEVLYVAFEGDAVARLPKHVVLKSDNDMYLAAYSNGHNQYLRFDETDIGSGEVTHEVVEVGKGIVMLKCTYWNQFWRLSPGWIWADTANANSSNKDLLFKPIKVDDQRVALRCLGNNMFCKRLTADGKTNCLNACTSSLESTAIFRVEEPALSRRVHSIEYHTDTARISDLKPERLFKATVTNTSDQTTTLQVAYSYMEKKSKSWKSGVSFKTGVKTTFEAGIPLVVDGKLEVYAEVTVSGEWGGTEEKQTTLTGTYPAPVKAGETVEVTVMGTNAKCDVPFSYTQEDLLTTGETAVTRQDNGLFTGINTTDIKFIVRSL